MPSPPRSAVQRALDGVRVCVVGINYAPEPTGSAPYTAGLAEMLAAHGAQVQVVTGIPHYPAWQVPPEYRWRLRSREWRNGVEVLRARHFVPGRQSAVARLMWEGTFLLNATATRPARPDLVLASTPSLSGGVVAARLAARYRAPLAVVVQDLVGQAARQSGIAGGGLVASSAGRVEGGVLRRADLVAVVSDSFRRQVHAYGVDDDRVRLLRNWTHVPPATRDRARVRQQLGWGDDVFVVLHTGNMGLKQDLGNVVEAGRLLAGRRDVLLVLMGDGSQRASVQQAAAGLDTVRFLDPVAGDLYPDVLRAADLLLVNELPTVGEMSLPSKLTSYFAAGQPVLAAASTDGACARELARSAGAGHRVDPGDPAALADAVLALAGDGAGRRAMAASARRYAEEHLGRESASALVLALAQELLSRDPRRGPGPVGLGTGGPNRPARRDDDAT